MAEEEVQALAVEDGKAPRVEFPSIVEPKVPGMMVGIDQKDGKSGMTHSTTNSGLRQKNIPFCPRAHDADHVRDVQRARGSCCSPEKAQASAPVDLPTAPKRRKDLFFLSLFGRPRSCL